jgi:NADH-quinone oxidoreductase subunit A
MLAQYAGVVVILVLAFAVAAGMLTAHRLLGPSRVFEEKQEPFECGEHQIVSPHQRFSVKFYVVAILFIIFDVEAVFIFPWAVVYRQLGLFGFMEMLVFLGILLYGLLYVWRKGALQWD